MTTIARNKTAQFNYEIITSYEAGIVLSGQEVKSIKTGHCSLNGAFVTVHNNELFLKNALIPRYHYADKKNDYDPYHTRKLLVTKSEIRSLIGKQKTAGLTLVPIRVYIKKKRIKLEFALARGKSKLDKRNSIKERETHRKIARAFRRS